MKPGTLEHAIALAAEYHAGQVDKAGEPFIFHPLRVMLRLRKESTEHQIVGVLHDIIEDTPANTATLINANFSSEIVAAVYLISRGKNETYEQHIDRIALEPITRRVKLADLDDNTSYERGPRITASLRARYEKAKTRLKAIGKERA